jgi:hypothetical protein
MSSSFFSVRRSLAATAAVLVLGGSAVGIAAAQTAPTPATTAPGQGQPPPQYQAFIDALAKRLGITSGALQTAVTQARTDAGLPAGGGFGFGHGLGGPRRGGFGPNLDAAATAIGIPVTQLQQELPGKTLTQVAPTGVQE